MATAKTSLDQDTLKHRIDEVPASILPHIQMGFSLLSRSSGEERKKFLGFAIEAFAAQQNIDSSEAADILNLNDNTIGDALAAISLTIGIMVDLSVSSDDFLNAGDGKLFSSENRATAEEVAFEVAVRKDTLRTALDDSSLANAILPSFRNLSYEIDVRLKFNDHDEVEANVPVAVLYLRTDCKDDVWFQATKNDVEKMIEKLTKAAARLSSVSNFVVRGE